MIPHGMLLAALALAAQPPTNPLNPGPRSPITQPQAPATAPRAQDAAPPATIRPGDRPLADLIKDLDSPDVATRVGATDSIYEDGSIPLRGIEASLASAALSPEQRQRLLSVAARRFQTEPRAAMGVQYDGNPNPTFHGVNLASVTPGFPASTVLKVNDRIIAAGGVTIDTWETLRAVIISHDPGDEIPVTVVREGATLNLKVTLGDYTSLKNQQGLDASVLSNAWQMRSRGLEGPATAAPIESGLPAVAWSPQAGPVIDDSDAITLLPFGDPQDTARVGLVAGGEPRGGLAPRIVTMPGGPRLLNMRVMPGNAINLGNPAVLVQDQAQAFREQILDLQAQLNQTNVQLADPTVPEAKRRDLQRSADVLDLHIRSIREQLRVLTRGRDNRPRR